MSWDELKMWAGVVFAVIWPLFGIYALVSTLVRKKNLTKSPLATYAAGRGWTFVDLDDSVLTETGYWRAFVPMPAAGACNVIRGSRNERDVLAFETFSKVERVAAEKPSQVQRQGVVAIRTPASRPWLQVYRENAVTRAVTNDLVLESEDFNRKFHVTAENTRFAYDVLTPQNMERMLRDPRYAELPFRFDGRWLWTLLQWGLTPEDIDGQLQFLEDTMAMVPSHAWSADA